MMKFLTALLAVLTLAGTSFAQSSPGLTYGQVPTAGQWNSFFTAKQDTLGYTPLNQAGGTMTGKLKITPSTGTGAGFGLLPGVNPTSPQDGDLWVTASGLYVQVNGSTIGPISSTTGTVTSVGLSAPSFLSVSGSPVTSSGTIGLSLASQTQNQIFASPNGSSGTPSFRAIVGDDLPGPSTSKLGGVRAVNAVTSNWVRSISTGGVPALSQPAFSDLSGTTNAVSNSILSQVTAPVFKGRATAGTGNVEDMSPTTATAQLNAMVGDSGSGGTKGLVPAPASGDAAAGKFLKADGTWTIPPASQTNAGYLFGLTLSNDATDAVNDIDIATGAAGSDAASSVLITLSSAMVKRTDTAWTAGTNQGCWLDGSSMPNGTGLIFLMYGSSGVDVGCSASTSPTLPAGYNTGKRRIGAILRESAALVSFTQDGNLFRRALKNDYSSASYRASALQTFSVPIGISVYPIIHTALTAITASTSGINSLGNAATGSADVAVAHVLLGGAGSTASVVDFIVPAYFKTDTSGRLYFAVTGSGTLQANLLDTVGWVDLRGTMN